MSRELERERLVGGKRVGDELRKPDGHELAPRDASREGFAAARDEREPGEERVVGCRVRVAGKGIEEEVGHGVSGEMLRHRDARCEDEPFGGDSARLGFAAQTRARLRIGLEQPEHASADLRQQSHPDREHVREDLVARVEAAEHEARVG